MWIPTSPFVLRYIDRLVNYFENSYCSRVFLNVSQPFDKVLPLGLLYKLKEKTALLRRLPILLHPASAIDHSRIAVHQIDNNTEKSIQVVYTQMALYGPLLPTSAKHVTYN